jgi:hypothetical protein
MLEYFMVIGTFCGALVHFVVLWYILWFLGTFCGALVHFVVPWYNFSRVGILCPQKYGNPGANYS